MTASALPWQIAPSADPLLPGLNDMAHEAFRLHALINALGLTFDGGALQLHPEATQHQRNAFDAIIPLIDVLAEKSRALADALEAVAQAKERAA